MFFKKATNGGKRSRNVQERSKVFMQAAKNGERFNLFPRFNSRYRLKRISLD
jgi:hypothetical protein